MSMKEMLPVIIEAVLFMIPLITIFIKIGKYAERIDGLEKQVRDFNTLDNRLTSIETKIDLLLQGKLKTDA